LYSFSRECLRRCCEINGFRVIFHFYQPMRRITMRLNRVLVRLFFSRISRCFAPLCPNQGVVCRKILLADEVSLEQIAKQV
jgi:hypothetical protein